MKEEGAAPVAAEGEEYSLSGSLIMYGILADLLVLAPVIIYLLLDDASGYAMYHQSYINMLAAAFAPMAIVWPSILFNDSDMTRKAIAAVVQMAGLGPFALLWVGYFTFLMSSRATDKLKESDNTTFAIIYGVGNIMLVVIHWIFSGSIMNWIKNTPLPVKEMKEEMAEEEAESADAAPAEAETEESEDSGDGW
jgi:predicted histidine transporter YuiF (NhaC family)